MSIDLRLRFTSGSKTGRCKINVAAHHCRELVDEDPASSTDTAAAHQVPQAHAIAHGVDLCHVRALQQQL